LPFNSVATDGGAGGVGKNQDDNERNSYERNSNALKQPVSLEKSGDNERNSYERNSNALKPLVSLEKSGDNERNSYERNGKKIGYCAHCGKEFIRANSWHKYCTELCKIRAYELRTGKKFYSKKTAA
jgi:hypothetical protein